MNKNEIYKLYDDTLANFEDMVREGVITEDNAQELKQQADQELQQYLANFTGESNMNGDYQYDLEELVEADVLKTRFGAAILELGEEAEFPDVDELAIALSEELQVPLEDIAGILTGDNVPDVDFVEAVVELFDLDEEETADLYEAAAEANIELAETEEYLAALEEEEMMEYSHPYNPQQNAKFNQINNNYSNSYSNQKVEQLENKIAEFESRDQLKEMLNQRVQDVQDLVYSGDMPPIVAEAVIGNFEMSGNDRIAAFSQTAANNGVSLEAELHATDKVVDIFKKLNIGQTGLFDQYINDEVAEFEASEDQQADQLAYGSLSAFKKQNAERLQ